VKTDLIVLHVKIFKMASTNVYVLQCTGGKYYVGKSDNVELRFQQHLRGFGSAWTRKYKPVKIVKTIPNTSSFEEDKQVKEYMLKYGIENVRGGSYVEEKMDDETMRFLKKELYGATDCCSRCGRNNHFVKNCHASTDVDGNKLKDEDDDEELGFGALLIKSALHVATEYAKKKLGNDTCYRCGREGHYAPDCYANKHVNGRWLN
jgi:predicted GIY-YIG superfamily endonuclease